MSYYSIKTQNYSHGQILNSLQIYSMIISFNFSHIDLNHSLATKRNFSKITGSMKFYGNRYRILCNKIYLISLNFKTYCVASEAINITKRE